MNIRDSLRTFFYRNKSKDYNQLTTTWGEPLDSDHVLQDYPRPGLVRASYVNLNGTWEYAITALDKKPERWQGRILVPFSPEAYLSGVGRVLQPEEYLWYRLIFPVDRQLGKRCILHFQAVDQEAVVYINGNQAGSHLGGYLPFEMDITNQLVEGDNELVVRVQDETDRGYHARGKQKLKRGGMYYTPQSGIWQTVWYEWVPAHYIQSLKMTADPDTGAIKIQASVSGGAKGLSGSVFFRGEEVAAGTSEGNTLLLKIPEGKLRHWGPEHPFLYDLKLRLGEDQVNSYTAFRKIELRKDEKTGRKLFYLNGKALFLNGVLDQGYWPDGLYTAPSDEALLYDITQAKALGFNMIRKHIKIESERFYYHCDRLGMLVWQDMVNGGEKESPILTAYLPTLFYLFQKVFSDKQYTVFGRQDKEGRKEWLSECKATIRMLRNHPSIVTWVPFNEGWGQFDGKKVCAMIKKMDPDRMVDHASGWYDQLEGDYASIHNYFRKQFMTRDHRAFVISELGGYACYVEGHSFSKEVFGYKVYTTENALQQAFTSLYDAEILPLKEQGLCGVVYTQICDVEEEVNGLMTYDRKVCKVDLPEKIKKTEDL